MWYRLNELLGRREEGRKGGREGGVRIRSKSTVSSPWYL